MVVVVFRARLREGVDMARLESTGARMYELASGMPGFVSYKDYAAPDGESLTLIEFETEDAVLAWREHPEHRVVQEQGRKEFFSEYHIQVCAPLRDYRFSPTEGRRELPVGQRGRDAQR
jgi:heme-degrading monooxygenase HmoA